MNFQTHSNMKYIQLPPALTGNSSCIIKYIASVESARGGRQSVSPAVQNQQKFTIMPRNACMNPGQGSYFSAFPNKFHLLPDQTRLGMGTPEQPLNKNSLTGCSKSMGLDGECNAAATRVASSLASVCDTNCPTTFGPDSFKIIAAERTVWFPQVR